MIPRPTSLVCERCDRAFEVSPRGKVPRFCSPRCQSGTKLSRLTGGECSVCGNPCGPRSLSCLRRECQIKVSSDRARRYARDHRARTGEWPSRKYGWTFSHEVTCLACGRTYASTNRRAKYCNKTCWATQNRARPPRPVQKNGIWPSSLVPDGHPSRSTQVPIDHPSRVAVLKPWPVFYGNCRDCDALFVSNTPVKKTCSRRCIRRLQKRARRAREFGAGGEFTWTQVMRLFMAFDKCCAYCLKSVKGQPDPDHVVPLSRGGHNTISNILPACRACNCDKQNLTLEEWATERVRLGKPAVSTSWDLSDVRYTHLALRPALPRPLAA